MSKIAYGHVILLECTSGWWVKRDIAVLVQIWDAVDSQMGYLTRNGLYKALALTALAQQGKTISDKMLDSYSGQGNQ